MMSSCSHYWHTPSKHAMMCFIESIMMTSSNGNIFRVTGPLCGNSPVPGEFPAQRPVARSFDVFLDLRLNKRLSKQSWGWWFKTPYWPLWRHYNARLRFVIPDSKVHGANKGPIRGRQDPGWPHVGSMNLAIWNIMVCLWVILCICSYLILTK